MPQEQAVTRTRSAPLQDAGLFGPESITWRIHGDPAMAVGGFRALLLQAVPPVVMAGFSANSNHLSDAGSARR